MNTCTSMSFAQLLLVFWTLGEQLKAIFLCDTILWLHRKNVVISRW